MNTIKENVWAMADMQRELGVKEEHRIQVNALVESYEEDAYKQGKVHLLVNCSDINTECVNINDYSFGKGEIEVLTSNGTYETENGDYIEFNCEDEYNEYIEENEIEDAPDWWDFAESSELMWSTFFKFNGYNINVELANELGLPVIELKNGETYISISGCGMDMSFQMMEYQALDLGRLDKDYATSSKLEWAKINMPTERYKAMLSALGVDIDKLEEKYYTK